MQSRYRLFLLVFVTLFFVTDIQSQSVEQFRTAAQEALEAFEVPGFSVGIIKDGKVVLAEGFGTRTAGKEETVDEHTLFAIASNTKAFVSTSIVKLHEEGKLDINKPVRDYLPYFQLYDEYVSSHMMVRDLLCHRAGLGTFSGDFMWYKSDLPAESVLRRIHHLPQAYEFRAGYGYTNLMFITAGEVIKAVTDQTWAEYVQANFLTPLGMTRTQTTVSNLANMDNVATPHLTRNDNETIPYVNWDNMGAAGGIVSSASDMLRWMKLQMNKGQKDKQSIFPENVTNSTWRPHNPLRGGANPTAAGLGWFVSSLDGHLIVNHGGGYDGMYSQVKMAPDDQLGVVVLTNSMTGLSSTLANYIINTYLGRDTEGWLKKAVERQVRGKQNWDKRRQEREEARVEGTRTTHDLSAYTGTYHSPTMGDITIEAVAGKLELHFADSPKLDATLSHWHYDTFRINWQETHAWFDFGTLQFELDNNLKVSGLSFDVPNDDIFFHEIEADKE